MNRSGLRLRTASRDAGLKRPEKRQNTVCVSSLIVHLRAHHMRACNHRYFFCLGCDAAIHVCKQRNRQEKGRDTHRREFYYIQVTYRLTTTKDVRDLGLHIIADSPPPNWVKIEVRALIEYSQLPELSLHRKSGRATHTRHTTRFSCPPTPSHLRDRQPKHSDRDTPPRPLANLAPVHRFNF